MIARSMTWGRCVAVAAVGPQQPGGGDRDDDPERETRLPRCGGCRDDGDKCDETRATERLRAWKCIVDPHARRKLAAGVGG